MQQLWCGLAGFSYLTFSLLAKVDVRHYFIRLDAVAKADLAWCNCFLQSWHGAAFVVSGSSPVVHVHSDASGSFGCGAVSDDHRWLQVSWPESWADVSIAVKEMATILLAAATWGCSWHHCSVFFHCDNAAVVFVIQRHSAKDPFLLHLLHCLYFYAARFQFGYSAHHLHGVSNVAADALSRDNMSLFLSLVPPGSPSVVSKRCWIYCCGSTRIGALSFGSGSSRLLVDSPLPKHCPVLQDCC